MLSNVPKRQLYLGGLALLLAILLVARLIAGWGLVTVHVKNAPIGKVIASIASQGHVRIESSVDSTNTVTMDVDRVSPAQAIDVLANNSESSWRVVYLAAPSSTAIDTAIATMKGTGRLEDWTTHYYPGPPFGGGGGQVIDPRLIALKTEGPDPDLSKLLDEAAQKSGVMTAQPKDWTPSGATLPKENRVDKVIPAMIASVHGVENNFFFLSERRRWGGPGGGDGGGDQGPPQGDGGPRTAGQNRGPGGPDGPGGGRQGGNPEWMQQRRLAQISQLPPDQQAAAKKEMDEMRAFFDSLKDLTPDERRAKFQDMMANSDMGQRMQDAQLVRQASQTPEQRINRAVNYIDRKNAQKASQSH